MLSTRRRSTPGRQTMALPDSGRATTSTTTERSYTTPTATTSRPSSTVPSRLCRSQRARRNSGTSGDIPARWAMRASPLSAATKELDVLRNRPDDLNQLLTPVAMLAGELKEFLGAGNNGAPFSRARDGDPPTAAELEQPLVTQQAKSSEDGVPIHTKHGC